MNPMQEKLNTGRALLRSGDREAAIALLNELHVECHAEALTHMRTHVALARAHAQAGHYRRATFELASIPFAGPASLVHKYMGLSRKLTD